MTPVDPPIGKASMRFAAALGLVAFAAVAVLVHLKEPDAPPPRPAQVQMPAEMPAVGPIDPVSRERTEERPFLVMGAHVGIQSVTPAQFVEKLRATIRALGENSEAVRLRALADLVWLAGNNMDVFGFDHRNRVPGPGAQDTEAAFAGLLENPSYQVRDLAARSLARLAVAARLETPPSGLTACLEHDEILVVRINAAAAIVEYARGPEILLGLILKGARDQDPSVVAASAQAVEQVHLLPSALPALIEGLSSEDAVLCVMCANSLEHMGREAAPALPALLALIREELKRPRPRTDGRPASGQPLGAAIKALARIGPADGPPGDDAILIACEAIRQGAGGIPNPADDKPPATARPSLPLKVFWDEQIQIGLDALKTLARPLPAAVPPLAEALDAPRRADELLYADLAGILYFISRGTAEQPRADASLGRAWREYRTASPLVMRGPATSGGKADRAPLDLRRFAAAYLRPAPPARLYHRWRGDRLNPDHDRCECPAAIHPKLRVGSNDDAG